MLHLFTIDTGGLIGALLDPGIRTPLKSLPFNVEAGRTYVVHGQFTSGLPVYWIEDEQTEQVIVGKKPHE